MGEQASLTSLDGLTERLQVLHRRTQETPLFNPVFQLSHEISRGLESGELSLDAIGALVDELVGQSLDARAARLRRLLDPEQRRARLTEMTVPAANEDFETYREAWSHPRMHAVFTAHPTFLLTPAQTDAVATGAITGTTPSAESEGEPPEITLRYEHDCAMAAMANAQDARDTIVAAVLGAAQAEWPDRWHELDPQPFRFATWVGYDMDGRTDITWYTSIAFRLAEKAQRLGRYAASLERIDASHALIGTLRAAQEHTQSISDSFAGDLSDPQALTQAADRLTRDDDAKLLSLAPLIEQLEAEARDAEPEHAVALRTVTAAMRADGLGMGWIHFRVNAKQLHNAIRRELDDPEIDLSSRGAMAALRDLLARAGPQRANFASLAVESSTAVRQFLAMAQILKHIDDDAPIRMLVAECEQPSTMLAALYFAKLFGIDDRIDISPLFETESALEHGGRFLDALLTEDDYRTYARRRGRIAIQTGFSDAGRFVGQIPASLAIERLQGRLCEAMAANDLTDVAALVFDTHGEGMGRGAHPASFADRLEWPLSPWARRRFARAGIRLEAEASFQGGDGYLFFAGPELALATLTQIAALTPQLADADAQPDPFYRRTDLSLDFYRAIKDHQHNHLESRTYSRAITSFGLGLLNQTGSRKSRRQSDIQAEREMSLRQIRAIPHNAILQQLGYPVNIIAGIGSAASGTYEDIAALLTESARGRQIMRLARSSDALASIKTVSAHGELFNSAYWASRTYRGTEDHLARSCEALAEYLIGDDRTGVFRRLASRLRVDALKFHRLLDLMPDEAPENEQRAERESVRRRIGALQALRLALLQHMFLKVVSVPAFSRANDISRTDVLEMVFSLRVDDALAQLRRAFPTDIARKSDFPVAEPGDYPQGEGEGYAAIRRDYIEPIERAYQLCLRISTAIANQFGAHG